MISRQTIQQIQSRIDIVDVLSDFISLKKRGVNLLGLCPFHGEKTPSFTVSPSKQIYKCFGCGKSGSAISFLMEHEKLSYPEALRWIANKYHITIEETELSQEEKQKQEQHNSIFTLNEFAATYFNQQLHIHHQGKLLALSYLKERSISDEMIRHFNLGYCPHFHDAHSFCEAAKQQQFQEEIMIASGLVKKKQDGGLMDMYSNRIIFPIHLTNGKIAGFGARKIGNADDKSPKYINTPQNEVYNKSSILYGLHLARETIIKQGFSFIVEGYTDVISLHQLGHHNAVASGGTSLTLEQVLLLKKYTNNVIVFYDSDNAGINATQRAINTLLSAGMDVETLLAPQNEDPDSFARKNTYHSFATFIQTHKKNFLDFLIETLVQSSDNISKKSAAIATIAETLSHFHRVEDLIKRQEYVKYASKKLDIDTESLSRLVNLNLRQKATSLKQKATQEEAVSMPENATHSISSQTKSIKSPLAEDYLDKHIRKIIAILIQYGARTWEDNTSVADYIFSYLEERSILSEIQNLTLLRIFDDYKTQFQKGNILKRDYFIYHEDEDIRQASVFILEEHEHPNKGWGRILPDQHESPDLSYIKEVNTSLCLLVLKTINRLVVENKKWIQQYGEQSMNEKEVTIETHKMLKAWAKEIARDMGVVMI